MTKMFLAHNNLFLCANVAYTISSKLGFLPCFFDSMNWYGYCQTYETMTIDIPVFLNHG